MWGNTQPLMRSQFIFVYGPGSIIESENGPRLIPNLEIGINKFSTTANKYKINDVRMENLISKERKNDEDSEEQYVHLFTLPSNASEGQPDDFGLYKTLIFPAWKICYNRDKHVFEDNEYDSNKPILYNSAYNGGKCPCCDSHSDSYVRFVAACPDGHLDDVPWKFAVHSDSQCHHDKYFIWDAKGSSSLASIRVKCPKCGQSHTMEEIYNKDYNCSARLPESEPLMNQDTNNVNYGKFSKMEDRENCTKRMKILQRQSTALRVPLTRTLLTLPKYETDLLKVIQEQEPTVRRIIIRIYRKTFEENIPFEEVMDENIDLLDGNDPLLKWLDKDYKKFLSEAVKLYEGDGEYYSLLNEEFKVLSDPSQEPSPSFEKGEPIPFNVNIQGIDFPIKVFPINKIRTITTQIGYQRFVRGAGTEGDDFKKRYIGRVAPLGSRRTFWYPAFEGIGEGIFVTSNSNPLEFFDIEKNISEWEDVNPKLFYNISDDIYKPLFVWWHTLSHAVIHELGFMSGYSSASIRERVYSTNDGRGGFLLYNTSVGDDCGMGGLVESSSSFDKIIENSISRIQNCSNDPLCGSVRVGKETINGSACINCLFLSETSCEVGNKLLDRHMLLGD